MSSPWWEVPERRLECHKNTALWTTTGISRERRNEPSLPPSQLSRLGSSPSATAATVGSLRVLSAPGLTLRGHTWRSWWYLLNTRRHGGKRALRSSEGRPEDQVMLYTIRKPPWIAMFKMHGIIFWLRRDSVTFPDKFQVSTNPSSCYLTALPKVFLPRQCNAY